MPWQIDERCDGYTVWMGHDSNGRPFWACTTNQCGMPFEPRTLGLYDRETALTVYHHYREYMEYAESLLVALPIDDIRDPQDLEVFFYLALRDFERQVRGGEANEDHSEARC